MPIVSNPPQSEKPVWDYERLYARVKEYVLDGFPHFDHSPLLFSHLSRSNDNTKPTITGIERHELMWLQYNLPFLKQVVDNKVASILVYYNHRNLGKLARPSFFSRDMARLTGFPEQTINRWARRVMVKELFKVYVDPIFRRAHYTLNTNYATINRVLFDLIRANYSEKEFEKILEPSKEKRRKIEARKKAVSSSVQNHKRAKSYYRR